MLCELVKQNTKKITNFIFKIESFHKSASRVMSIIRNHIYIVKLKIYNLLLLSLTRSLVLMLVVRTKNKNVVCKLRLYH